MKRVSVGLWLDVAPCVVDRGMASRGTRWPGLQTAVRRGLMAGAAGTTALDVVTYLDMAVRGRASSDVPARTAARIAESMGLVLGENRSTASGALLGYADGVVTGALYGLLRSAARVPWPLAAVALAVSTLVVGEGTATRAGATDWSKWSLAQWIEDIVPRLVYGAVTSFAMESLAEIPSTPSHTARA